MKAKQLPNENLIQYNAQDFSIAWNSTVNFAMHTMTALCVIIHQILRQIITHAWAAAFVVCAHAQDLGIKFMYVYYEWY